MESMTEEEQIQRAMEMSKAESSQQHTTKAPVSPRGPVAPNASAVKPAKGQSNVPTTSGGLPPRLDDKQPSAMANPQPPLTKDLGQPMGNVPKLSLDTQRKMPIQEHNLPREFQDVHLGHDCENEIDRLVRERLEGGYSSRVYANRYLKGSSRYHDSWLGRVNGGVREAAWGVCEAISWGGNKIVGGASAAADHVGSSCSRFVKATPIYIGGDDDDWYDDDLYQGAPPPHLLTKQDEEFKDLISAPAATLGGLASSERPFTSSQPVDYGSPPEQFTSSQEPSKAVGSSSARQQPAGGRQGQSDRASALSVSSQMTSSAAQVLGGLGQATQRPKAASSTNRPIPENEQSASSSDAYQQRQAAPKSSSGRQPQGSETKSVLASSSVGMNSSAAAALGGLTAKSGGSNQRRSAEDTQSTLGQSTVKSSGGDSGRQKKAAASVVSGMQGSTSNSSAVLGPLLQGGQQRRKGQGDMASVVR